jgi:hypothetical protein
MNLHDWNGLSGWGGFHTLWLGQIFEWIQPRLPDGFRAYFGQTPILEIGRSDRIPGGGEGTPDVAVRREHGAPDPAEAALAVTEPDEEGAAELGDIDLAVVVERFGRMVAAVELVSPSNKDRSEAKAQYLARYLGYLTHGANLLLVDVHAGPRGFSFADELARSMSMPSRPLPAPHAVSFRVGGETPDARRWVAVWRRPMAVGGPLPTIPLPLTPEFALPIDLAATYAASGRRAYLG